MATIQCCGHLFQNISAVLFDKDGTLATVEDYLIALGQERTRQIELVVPRLASGVSAAMGIIEKTIDPTGLMAIASRKENEVAAAAYVAATGKGWMASLSIVRAAFDCAEAQLPPKVSQTPLTVGGRSLISQLRAAEIKVGIVSSDTHTAVGEFIAHYNLTSEIDWYCGASTATPEKTAPGFLSFACAALGQPPGQTLVIGDSAADLSLANQGAAGFLAMVGAWRSPPVVPSAQIIIHQLSQVECFD